MLYATNHWVATACIGGQVLLADSVRKGNKISEVVAVQLKQLYGRLIDPQRGMLQVAVTLCAQQTNASDCGVYATAVAFEWVLGHQNLPLKWEVPALRPHLLACLEGMEVRRFPQSAGKRGRRPRAVLVLI